MVIAFLGDAPTKEKTPGAGWGRVHRETDSLSALVAAAICLFLVFFPGKNAYFATFTKSRQNCITALEGCQTIESHLLSYFTAQCVKCAVRILTYIDRCFTHIVGVPWNTWRGRSVDIKMGSTIDETLHFIQKYKKVNTQNFSEKYKTHKYFAKILLCRQCWC